MSALKTWMVALLAALAAVHVSLAVSVTGADWIVHFNLPDQVPAVYPGEFAIRDALLARLNALQTNDEATLATYTFSGNTASAGAAGPILQAMSNALARGATLRFVADGSVDATSNFWPSVSLSSLAARPGNALALSEDDSSFGIMHDKLGVFRYGTTSRWVFITSWNFTGGASTYQWNMALEVRNDVLFNAYTNEMNELLAGRFHDDATKSHAHDGARFALADSWDSGWVRFAPYPDGADGGTNAQTDIANLIGSAESEIVFAINLFTTPLIATSLVHAANRGVIVHGVIPQSDQLASYSVYPYLTNVASYATTNVIHFVTPFSKADGSALDAGESDLVHEKWMIIDPWTERPVVIHGSANWTASALASTDMNDENVLLLCHKDIARIFYAQFKRMTGMWTNRSDFWCDILRTNGSLQVGLWMTDTNQFGLQHATRMDEWASTGGVITGVVGRVSALTNGADQTGFFRAMRK